MGIPVSVIAGIGAAILLVVAGRGHVISTRKVMREAPWSIVIFLWACTWLSTACAMPD